MYNKVRRNLKVDVIGNKVYSPLLFVLLLLIASVFALLAFDMLLLCFTGNYSRKCLMIQQYFHCLKFECAIYLKVILDFDCSN